MSTVKPNTGGDVKNNGGTVVAGGTLVDSPMTKVINTNELNTGTEYGSKVKEKVADGGEFSDPHGVIKAKESGTGGLAYYPDPYTQERNFLLRGAGDSASKINNDLVSFLNVPGAHYLMEIAKYAITNRHLREHTINSKRSWRLNNIF
jgi:hypothetical protein